jgi:hypothetical protein
MRVALVGPEYEPGLYRVQVTVLDGRGAISIDVHLH